jgi:membrane-associated phospholipid phosphatase
MTSRTRYSPRWILLLLAVAWGCTDRPTESLRPPAAQRDVVKFWEATASTRWNQRATVLVTQSPPANAQAAVSRILTYLSLAQYRAVLAAEDGKVKSMHPSVSAAVGGASAAVLKAFFPLDAATIEGQLAGDLAAPGWPGEKNDDAAAGETIGRAVGAEVLAMAATDNYFVSNPGVPPVGPGYWVSAPAAIVRSLYGTRPFFLSAANQLRPGPPPAFGSPAFLTALAEIRAISDTRTAEQLAIAQSFSWATGPFTAGNLNLIADRIIVDHRRTEREAARILTFANAAAFDAQIACFDAKFTYWFIRPSQADPAITLAVALPNHPSYPSAHSCITSAFMTVLIDAFPSERPGLQEIITKAGLGRMYAGIHYRFDIEAGQAIGRGTAALALAASRK